RAARRQCRERQPAEKLSASSLTEPPSLPRLGATLRADPLPMLFGEIIIVALQSIRANLFRAALTMLGIIIGVGAVITMLAAGAGAQKRIDDQIAALGANILTVNASNFFPGGVSA